MPLDDPNDPQGPETPPEPAPPPAPEPPEAPHYDVERAYDVIAQAEGWDPRLTRYEIQEHRRRVQEFERERKQFEQERARQYQAPQDDGADPYMRRISNLERIMLEDREERRRQSEEANAINQVSQELKSSYIANARMAGMTKEQAEAAEAEFYETITDMYPEVSMIQRIGSERAARNAFRLLRQNGSARPSYNPQVNGRGPTATRTIPGSPQPYMPAGNPLPPEDNLSAEQLEGETDDQYRARLERIISGANLRRLPDGSKVSSR